MTLVGQWILILLGGGFTLSLILLLTLCRASRNGDRLVDLFPREPEER